MSPLGCLKGISQHGGVCGCVCEERGLSCKGPHHQDFKSLILRQKKNKAFSNVFMHVCSPVHVLYSLLCPPSCIKPPVSE